MKIEVVDIARDVVRLQPRDWTGLIGFIRRLVGAINERLQIMSEGINNNEATCIHWTDGTALPTPGIEYAGRFLYWDRGQGAINSDEVHVCYWLAGTGYQWYQII